MSCIMMDERCSCTGRDITGWVGTMGAEGSTKALASYDAGDSDFDDDVTSPAVIPPGSKYWFEVVTGDKKELGSIDFKR